MEAHLDEPISIEELYKVSCASWRTLVRAFIKFPTEPKGILLRLRPIEVRLELLASSPSEANAEIANRHGFWHIGKFGRDCRQVFGELSSETLHRAG